MTVTLVEFGQFRQNRFLQIIIGVFLVFTIIMGVSPYNRFDWVLEHLLVIVFLGLLAAGYRYANIKFSNVSYLLIALFMMLHIYGAHYSYNTPISAWLESFSGFERDNYDRVVHFSFGLLIAYPGYEFLRSYVGINRAWAYGIVVIVILAMGAFYELIEMWVAQIVAPEMGALFLGAQGDGWDAQHDMAVAIYGAVLAMVITAIMEKISYTKGKGANHVYQQI